MSTKTVTVDLSHVEVHAHYEGHATLEIWGRTPGGATVKVKVRLGFTTPGYLARSLSDIVTQRERELAEMRLHLPRRP